MNLANASEAVAPRPSVTNAAWTVLSDAVRRSAQIVSQVGTLSSRLAISAIERVYGLSGARGVYHCHVSRAMRDVLAGTQHMASNPATAAKDAGTFLLTTA